MISIEKLESLPTRLSRKAYITEKYGNMWDLPRFDHPWHRSVKGEYPYVKAERIIKKYMGKSFDKAFSEYCEKVELFEQKEFLDLFKDRRWKYADYMIDSQKRIQLNPERYQNKKYPITFRSFDYQLGYYDTIRKEFITEPNRYWYYNLKDDKRYIRTVMSGFEKTFESKKDPEYQRLQAEKEKAIKRNERLLKEQKKNKQYCFLTDKEIEEKKLKQAA